MMHTVCYILYTDQIQLLRNSVPSERLRAEWEWFVDEIEQGLPWRRLKEII